MKYNYIGGYQQIRRGEVQGIFVNAMCKNCKFPAILFVDHASS